MPRKKNNSPAASPKRPPKLSRTDSKGTGTSSRNDKSPEQVVQAGSMEKIDLDTTPKRKHSSPLCSPRRKKARKDSSSSSDSQPENAWLSLKDFEKLAYLTETLPDRYKDKNIEVEEFFNRPDTIRLINVPSEEEETFTVEGFTESSQLLPSESLDKWFSVENEEKIRRLKLFLDALTEGCEGLCLEKKRRNSYWYLHNVKKAVNESKMNLYSTEGESRKAKKVKNDATKDKSGGESGDANGKKKQQFYSYYEKRLVNELVYNFVVGMTHSMHNSKGRQFLQTLLEAALYVCLNEEELDVVKVMNVGSSVATHEGFPVKILKGAKEQRKHEGITSPCLKQTITQLDSIAAVVTGIPIGTPGVITGTPGIAVGTSVVPVGPSIIPYGTPGIPIVPNPAATPVTASVGTPGVPIGPPNPVSTPATPSVGTPGGSEKGTPVTSACGQSNKTRSSHCAGFIFPDIAVTSFKDSSAKYLVIGEVKSTELSKREMSQIWREMIGAGMFQNVVFGVVINQFEGKIWKMTVNKENNTVKFSREIYCSFFQAADMCMFFRYLIAVLDYAHRNVSVLEHKFILSE